MRVLQMDPDRTAELARDLRTRADLSENAARVATTLSHAAFVDGTAGRDLDDLASRLRIEAAALDRRAAELLQCEPTIEGIGPTLHDRLSNEIEAVRAASAAVDALVAAGRVDVQNRRATHLRWSQFELLGAMLRAVSSEPTARPQEYTYLRIAIADLAAELGITTDTFADVADALRQGRTPQQADLPAFLFPDSYVADVRPQSLATAMAAALAPLGVLLGGASAQRAAGRYLADQSVHAIEYLAQTLAALDAVADSPGVNAAFFNEIGAFGARSLMTNATSLPYDHQRAAIKTLGSAFASASWSLHPPLSMSGPAIFDEIGEVGILYLAAGKFEPYFAVDAAEVSLRMTGDELAAPHLALDRSVLGLGREGVDVRSVALAAVLRAGGTGDLLERFAGELDLVVAPHTSYDDRGGPAGEILAYLALTTNYPLIAEALGIIALGGLDHGVALGAAGLLGSHLQLLVDVSSIRPEHDGSTIAVDALRSALPRQDAEFARLMKSVLAAIFEHRDAGNLLTLLAHSASIDNMTAAATTQDRQAIREVGSLADEWGSVVGVIEGAGYEAATDRAQRQDHNNGLAMKAIHITVGIAMNMAFPNLGLIAGKISGFAVSSGVDATFGQLLPTDSEDRLHRSTTDRLSSTAALSTPMAAEILRRNGALHVPEALLDDHGSVAVPTNRQERVELIAFLQDQAIWRDFGAELEVQLARYVTGVVILGDGD